MLDSNNGFLRVSQKKSAPKKRRPEKGYTSPIVSIDSVCTPFRSGVTLYNQYEFFSLYHMKMEKERKILWLQ
jgi:hypothetical protein